MAVREIVNDLAQIRVEERLVGGRGCVCSKQFSRRGVRAEPWRPFPREQARHEVRPAGGQLEQRLVHQMLDQVLPPDVDDERHLRLQRGDVGEVLLGTDAEVDAARLGPRAKRRDDGLDGRFVRHEVVEREVPFRLRELADELPEVGIADLRGSGSGRGPQRGSRAGDPERKSLRGWRRTGDDGSREHAARQQDRKSASNPEPRTPNPDPRAPNPESRIPNPS